MAFKSTIVGLNKNNMVPSISRVAWRPLVLLLAFLISTFPSGELGGVNVRVITAFLCLITLIFLVASKSIKVVALSFLIICFCSTMFMGIWWLLGILQGNSFATDQYRGFAVTLLVIGILMFALIEDPGLTEGFLRSVVYGNLIYCSFKILLIISIYFNILTFSELLKIFQYADTIPVTLEIVPRLIRIQTISDALTPFVLALVLIEMNVPRGKRKIIALVLVTSLLLSYARVLWALALMVWLLRGIIYVMRKVNAPRIIGATVLLLCGVIFAFTGPLEVFLNRFSGQQVVESDRIRTLQIDGLLNSFNQAPIWGRGLGAYVENIIRDPLAPYSYEVQWLSILMQVGVIGVTFLTGILVGGLVFMLNNGRNLSWVVLYCIWIVTGFTNPYLISSISSIVFVVCLYFGYVNRLGTQARLGQGLDQRFCSNAGWSAQPKELRNERS